MIRRYEDSDYEQISSWQHARGLNMPESGYLSNIGFIIPNKASGFLYTTNSNICHLEMLIANPSINKKDRDEALDLIVTAVIDTATNLGFKVITSTTTIEAVKQRSELHGFYSEESHTLLIKKLQP